MSLLSMPAELLHQTCRFIGKIDLGRAGVNDFRSLSQSCRFFYNFVLPYLYRRVQLGQRNTFLLLRSIVKKPELALAIERVSITGRDKGQPDLGKAYTLLRKTGLLPKTCTRYLHPNDHQAIVILLAEALMLQLSNVNELAINVDSFPQRAVLFDKNRWKPSSRACLARLVPALKKLVLYSQPLRDKKLSAQVAERESQEGERELREHEADLEEDERESDEHRNIFLQTQYLIAISEPQQLYIETDFGLKYSSFDLTLPGVERLDIWCEGMSQEDFELLLQACPNVRLLQYSGGAGPPDPDNWDDDLTTVRSMVAALRQRQHTLESLEIGFFYEPDGYIMAHDTIPDLRHFSRLNHLKVDSAALFEAPHDAIFLPILDAKIRFIDKLPRTLEKLRIFQAYEEHLEELKSLAHRRAQDLPNLKTLILEWWCGETDEPLDGLEDELSKAGIELVFE